MPNAIGIASTGLTLHRTWLDAVSDNMANVNTVRATNDDAFRERYIMAQSGVGDSGAYVAGISYGDAEGRVVYDPNHPLADEAGNVRYPDIDLAAQMGQLIMAQRGYQANAAVVDRAKVMYESGLQIGK